MLHLLALHVLRAQAERRACAHIDLSATIDTRHRPALPFDGVQHRHRPIRPIILPDTYDEGATQIIVINADSHHRAPRTLGQDGPVGFDPLAVALIRARFRVTHDPARFLDQPPPGGFRDAFGFTLPVEAMTDRRKDHQRRP